MKAAERNALIVMIGMAIFHIGALAVIWVGISPIAVAVAIVAYVLRAWGVTAGFHRLLAHGSYKTSRPVQFIITLFGCLSSQGAPLWWVSHHRNHHRYTETPRDIHSPTNKGFWYSHIGWMLDKVCFEGSQSNVKDLMKFREIVFLHKYYPLILLAQALAFYGLGEWLAAANPALGTSGAQMLVWGVFISTVALWHATFMVNSVCHIWGKRPYDAGDHSTNNPIVAFLTLGEGWHNNHHRFPASSRHGLEWWQVDPTWLSLKLMQGLGLVRDLKVPSEAQLATKIA